MVIKRALAIIGSSILILLLTQCNIVVSPITKAIETLSSEPSATDQVGCTLPSRLISDSNIREFFWNENSESITFKEKNTKKWHEYNIESGQYNSIDSEPSPTPTVDFEKFGINSYIEKFISPGETMILFSRETDGKYALYYKYDNKDQEFYLGTIHGQIDKVDWFNEEENAIIAIDWQSPEKTLDGYVYLADFNKNRLDIEIPVSDNLKNIEYIGLTPDEKKLMFVSYSNKDRLVKMWNISTNEIISTPIFHPLSYRWLNETELISIGYQNPDLFPLVSIIIYQINTSNIIYLSEAIFRIDPFILNSVQISPDGSSIAYIEDKTDNLFLIMCEN